MQQFIRDWRNPALLVSVLLVILLAITLMRNGQSIHDPIVNVAGRKITRMDYLHEIQRRSSDQLLIGMIRNTLLSKYALDKHITVSDGEIEQLLTMDRISAKIKGQSLEDFLKDEDTTVPERRQEIANQIVQVKIIVPEADIKKAIPLYVTSRQVQLIPAQLHYHQYIAIDEKSALQIAQLLQQHRVDEALKLCPAQSVTEAQKERFYLDGGPMDIPKEAIDALRALKAGEVSKPLVFNITNGKIYCLLQLDSITPPEQPTFDKLGMRVGLLLLNDRKYEKTIYDIFSEVLQKNDVTFYSDSEFPTAFKAFQQFRDKNLQVPNATGRVPGLDTSGPSPTPRNPPSGTMMPRTGPAAKPAGK